jgi:hypothetical protein
MICSKLRVYLFIATNIILFGNESYGKDNLLLQCSGVSFMEFNLIKSQPEKKYKTYNIRNGDLVESVRGQEKSFKPYENNINTLRYSIANELGHLKENYHLHLDRVSGRVEERFDTFPNKGYWRFEGYCEKTIRKF